MKNNSSTKIESNSENWENEKLGADGKFAIRSNLSSAVVDDSLELQAISIRLQKSLISDMKVIAKYNGISGYQPLMRRVLNRFVEAEMKKIARDMMANQLKEEVDNNQEIDQEEPEAKYA
jgi:predicted DNA binding CopG/RHH family protein